MSKKEKSRKMAGTFLHGKGHRGSGVTAGQNTSKDVSKYRHGRSVAHAAANTINMTNPSFNDMMEQSPHLSEGRIVITPNMTTTPSLDKIDKARVFTEVINGQEVYFVNIVNFETVTLVTSYNRTASFTKDRGDANYWHAEIK